MIDININDFIEDKSIPTIQLNELDSFLLKGYKRQAYRRGDNTDGTCNYIIILEKDNDKVRIIVKNNEVADASAMFYKNHMVFPR